METPPRASVMARLVVGLVVALVVGVVAVGLIIAGPPERERQRRADRERITDLQGLSTAISQYYMREKALPDTLEQVRNQPELYAPSITDPKTRQPYRYRKLGKSVYELCADFETDTTQTRDRSRRRSYEEVSPFWNHRIGSACFRLEVKK
ncbi:MAG TPA: hypothetical protein VK689_09770 [Armatimonadota bacterium]|nr:hypothetical protein [Armatimonadota bacterium]